MQIILASGSIGRKELLQYIGISFDVIKSTIDEYAIVGSTPYETLKLRAQTKGKDICNKIANNQIGELRMKKDSQYIVLAADTSVVFNNQLYGKPKDRKEAVKMLQLFSGNTHEVVTATYIGEISNSSSQILLEESATSFVTFKTLSEVDINRYLNVTDYTRFAGSYAINSGQDFIVKLEGSISNVVGLPLELIMPLLEKKVYLGTNCYAELGSAS